MIPVTGKFTCLFIALWLSAIGPVSSVNAAEKTSAAASYTGVWSDSENTDIKMNVTSDDGLLQIVGGDEYYGYTIACLFKDMSAVCSGDGGKLEGENFLYQSRIEFTGDGTAIENWKAFNNLQKVEGKTTWKRD